MINDLKAYMFDGYFPSHDVICPSIIVCNKICSEVLSAIYSCICVFIKFYLHNLYLIREFVSFDTNIEKKVQHHLFGITKVIIEKQWKEYFQLKAHNQMKNIDNYY
ncbi:hypothetical protein BLOT_010991 [Blomia tropicalis]|nr:hypothetical protein BLOT_010991 [Blomia tropicalis]